MNVALDSKACRQRRFQLESFRRDRLYFAQVREDPTLEISFLEPAADSTYVVVGSGGCTALSLLAAGAGRVVAVDLNATQNDLLELKWQAVSQLGPVSALQFLGGASTLTNRWTTYCGIRDALTPDARQYWNRHIGLIRAGVLSAGVTEKLVRTFVKLLRATVHKRQTLDELFEQRDLDAQDNFYSQRWDTWRWRLLLRLLSRDRLVRTYDQAFFENVEERDFAGNFRRQIEHTLRSLPVGENYFLRHMLQGCYRSTLAGVAPAADPVAHGDVVSNYGDSDLPPYLAPEGIEQLHAGAGQLEIVDGAYTSYLRECPSSSINGFVISNIAEWLSSAEIGCLFEQIIRTAAPGARLCMRNFVGWTEVPENFRDRVREDRALGTALMQTDRSLVQRRFSPCHILAGTDDEDTVLPAVREARPDDDRSLRQLAAACPMRGDVELCTERESSFFALSRLEGVQHSVAVIPDRDLGVRACITLAERECYLNGEVARIAHLGDLKVSPAWRGRRQADALTRWATQQIRERLGPCAPILLTVLAGNRAMEKRLPGAAEIPCSTRVGTIRIYSIPLLIRPALVRQGLRVEAATDCDVEEMCNLWARVAPCRQFTARLDPREFRVWLEQAPGLGIGDYLLVRNKQDHLLGFFGLWDQRSFKQLRVVRYSAQMQAFRRIFNVVAPLLGASRLPPAGSRMASLSTVHICVPQDRGDVLRSLINSACRRARRAGFAFINIGIDRDDLLKTAFRGLFAQTTDVHAYLSSPAGSYRGPQLDGRPIHYEIALV